MCSRGWTIQPLTLAGWCWGTNPAARREAVRHSRERQPPGANYPIHGVHPEPDSDSFADCNAYATPTPSNTPTPTPTLTPSPTITPTPTASPTPFSHPLLFPPVAIDPNVSIGIDEACVQILDGPCTNMWTYGGTYPGITIRRPTGQTTNVTFTNNLDPAAGELTVHNHGNHSTCGERWSAR